MQKKSISKLIAFSISMTVVLLFAWVTLSENKLAYYLKNRVDSIFYDIKTIGLPSNRLKNSDITIVDIDDKSLKKIGRWPWSRMTIAKLLKNISASEPAVIGFDIIFSEPETNPAQTVLSSNFISQSARDEITAQRHHFDFDKKLSAVIKNNEAILGYTFFTSSKLKQGSLPLHFSQAIIEKHRRSYVPLATGFIGNLAILNKTASDAGFLTYFRDTDGITRRVPLLLRYSGKIYYSFALAIAKAFLLEERVEPVYQTHDNVQSVHSVKLGNYDIPTNQNGEIYIPFYGDRHTFSFVSAADVLNGTYDKSKLEGKIVLIGSSAIGLSDLVATPVSATFPGVEVQASIIQGILDKNIPYRPFWISAVEMGLLLVLGFLLSIALPLLKPVTQLSTCLSGLFILITTDLVLWHYDGVIIHIATCAIMIIFLGMFHFLYGFIFTASHEKKLKKAFARYIPPDQVNKISDDPTAFNLQGEERKMTVLFCDIRNFTSISEKLTASELKSMLNNFFTPLTKIIFENRGTIDKYVGDMIMAFWGAPLRNQNHANDALVSALKMVNKKNTLLPEFEKKGIPPFTLGVGLNTGRMNVGDMGSEYRQSYTVIGDNVNLGSRLESLTKIYGVNILISESTHEAQDQVFCLFIDKIIVKGRTTGVNVFHPMKLHTEATSSDHHIKNEIIAAYSIYLTQDWDRALEAYKALEDIYHNTTYCELFINRINAYKLSPPPADWDGSYLFTIK